ncbi:MAG: UDP-N-acetylglucosamine 2-epimerase [Bacteroidota bacterium]
MSKRRICVVTGTRAEYGLLFWLLKELQQSMEFELQLVVTGMHLSPEFGLTYKTIEQDGFEIREKIEMLLSSDSPLGTAKSMGLGIIGFADALERLHPDLMIVLGDRYEILAAVQAALVCKIPTAHIAGGDTTEGAFDEAIRHSITKMSHLHFVTNEEAARRVRQLGENPEHIYNVGNPGLDYIKKLQLLTKEEIEERLQFKFFERNLLVTFHPVTLDEQSSAEQFKTLLSALESFKSEIGIIFTKPNADPGGRILIKMIDDFIKKQHNAKVYTSLGQLLYLSLISIVDAVIGNSSSGLYEVPSFKKPTVNIGDRQKGRLQATSVINCQPETKEIIDAIQEAFTKDCSQTINPYGDGNSSQRIINILKSIPDYKLLLKKHFYEVEYK